jgi:signal peptidase I
MSENDSLSNTDNIHLTEELPQTEAASSPPTKKVSVAAYFLDFLEILVFAICTTLLIFTLFFRVCRVDGNSMRNTLHNQEVLITSNLSEVGVGDIVVFHQINDRYPQYNEPIIKRVIATEGQHVVIDFSEATVTVDGKTLNEDYIYLSGNHYRVLAEHHMRNGVFDAIVPDGCVFVMGDNRNRSLDSRSSIIQFVDTRRIVGRVLTRLTPTELFGPVQ